MIPKIIFQTWDTINIPPIEASFAQGWKDKHPDFDYICGNNLTNLEFVKLYFPAFLDLYHNFSIPQQADLIRYMWLYQIGGVYIDLDIECIRPISDLLAMDELLSRERSDNKLNAKFLIANFFIATNKGSKLMAAVLDHILKTGIKQSRGNKLLDVLSSTGPVMLTEVYSKYVLTNPSPVLLHSDVFSPISHSQLLKRHPIDYMKLPRTALGIHHYHGSWW